MNDAEISMVQECVTQYVVKENGEGDITITIDVPKRFADLWLATLSELRTTMTEIDSYSVDGSLGDKLK